MCLGKGGWKKWQQILSQKMVVFHSDESHGFSNPKKNSPSKQIQVMGFLDFFVDRLEANQIPGI